MPAPSLRFYNSLTHQIEPFEPLRPPTVSMYNCGPTVYDFAHIGNFKTFLFADVLRRTLELFGHTVHQVMNLTDVGHMTEDQLADGGGEDKMQLAARRLKDAKKLGQSHASAVEDPDDPYQVASFYIDAFLEDARALRLKIADEYPQRMPRATDHVPGMVAMVQRLVEQGHAYVAQPDGEPAAVYFSVGSFADYGQLSGNTLDQLRGGAGGRVQAEHQQNKRHPADFLLWKSDPSHLMKWDSPWGPGYPGWHIECSAMARGLLGHDVIDIHTGGEDNIFPHHECEIAQSRGASGEASFARFWMHSRHLMIEGRKMSKSQKNFYTLRDVLDGGFTGRPVAPAVLRFELLKANYRTQLNFTRQGLLDSAGAVQKLRDAAARWAAASGQAALPDVGLDHPVLGRIAQRLGDDLNTAGALGELFEYIGSEPSDAGEALSVLREVDSVLGVLDDAEAKQAGDNARDQAWADAAAGRLDDARAGKDFDAADALRAELVEAGYEVQTTGGGTVARRKLA